MVRSDCTQPIAVRLFSLLLASAFCLTPSSGNCQSAEPKLVENPRAVTWATSRFRGRPEPPLPYRAEVAFPNLKLKRPVALTNAPGTDRLFAVQIAGEVVSFREPSDTGDAADVAETDQLIDLRDVNPDVRQVYGLAFHPQYPQQPYVYIVYILDNKDPQGTIVSRFTVDQLEPPRADPKSERQIIRWLSGGHNGCCLKFGPDGFLYISAGDGEGPNPPDIRRAGQDVTNVLSTIMRIDVDQPGDERNYSIPPDNPFVDMPNARPEIYAFGFRNPWRMSFDRKTGDFWVGDVGWDLWELVFRVERGGNYGWSIVEGSNPIHPTEAQGPGPILPPVVQHHHSEARSITGGYVYHGRKYPDLQGKYVYGDYNTGKIWALESNDGKAVDVRELTDTSNQIIGWCETNDGELYYVDYQRTNQVYHLVPNGVPDTSSAFPRKLSDTGLFSSLLDYRLASGVGDYSVSAAMWDDGRQAVRHLAIPDAGQITTAKNGSWRFPADSVAVRTVTKQIDGVEKRLETQVLHYESNEWRPYSYVWNEAQDEATLAPAEGMEVDFGSYRHRVASRVECRICHNKPMRGLLGLTAMQLTGESLATLQEKGLLAENSRLKSDANTATAKSAGNKAAVVGLVDPYDETQALEQRARSYLHVNCVYCHRPEGGGPSPIHLDFGQTLEATKLVDSLPVQGDFQIPDARIVSPGDPMRSILFYRMAKVGAGHMPHIGAREIDDRGIRLMHDWIASLQPEDTTGDDAVAQLLATPQGALRLSWMMRSPETSAGLKSRIVKEALASDAAFVRDLLEPFFPAEARKERLGVNFSRELVLAKTGDADRGEAVFRRKELQCVTCHAVGDSGGELGPPLDEIGRTYRTGAEMLETIVEPSKKILPDYQLQIVVTTDGETLSGRVVGEATDSLTLLQVDHQKRLVPFADIEAISTGDVSMMPAQLLQSLTVQEAADLVAYLLSCTQKPAD